MQFDRLFYDGHCGLCHWAVRFILAHERAADRFRFTPLDSELFHSVVPEAERIKLGQTLVVFTAEGKLLSRSRAVLHIMRRLGGGWRLLAGMLWLIPPFVADRLYDVVAWSRHRLFRRPADVCPVLPEHLRQKFDF